MIVVVTLLVLCVVVDHIDVLICELTGAMPRRGINTGVPSWTRKLGNTSILVRESVLDAHNSSQEEGWLPCTRRSRGAPKVCDYLSLSTNVEKELDGSRTQSSQFPNLTSLLETSYLFSP